MLLNIHLTLPLGFSTLTFPSIFHFHFPLQAKKVTKGLWLLAAILSSPTAYARVNMEVILMICIDYHLYKVQHGGH